MSNEDQNWITVPRFFEIGYDHRDDSAKAIWKDLANNSLGWYGWSSHSPNYSHEEINELVEIFMNHHSAIDMEGNRIYTQMPAGTFFYVIQGEMPSFVRGAVWSNGAFWEEIPSDGPRQMSLSMDSTTLKAFSYVSYDIDPDNSIAKLMDSWVKNEDDNNDENKKDTTPT